MSLSARRAWIEIYLRRTPQQAELVALRKESVDRNFDTTRRGLDTAVALRKESVDRNGEGAVYIGVPHWSLSARRAWIEIKALHGLFLCL